MGRRSGVLAGVSLAIILFTQVLLPDAVLGLTEAEEVPGPDPEEVFEPLPELLQAKFEALYPEFSNVFTLFVDWDPEVAYQFWPWHPDSVESLVTKIMPPQTQQDMYDLSIAERVLRYCGDDQDDAYDQVHLEAYHWAYPHTHFSIRLNTGTGPNDGSYADAGAGVMAVQLFFVPGTPYVDPEKSSVDITARDAFAHEWQHLVYQSRFPRSSQVFGWDSATGASGATTELNSQGAEYKNGVFWTPATTYWPATDLRYSTELANRGHYVKCMGIADEGDDWFQLNLRKHHCFKMFVPYLVEHYRLGASYDQEALYNWLRVPTATPPGLPPDLEFVRQDFSGLSELLGLQAYNPHFYFAGDNPAARVREMFQEYALSLWVNQAYRFGIGDAALWAAGASPQETCGWLRDWNGYCENDAETMPLYHHVTTAVQGVADFVYPGDIFDSGACADYFQNPRTLQIGRYAYAILPFIADPSLDTAGSPYNLRVAITLDDEYPCNGETLASEVPDNDVFHFWALGYSESTTELDLHGAEAELLFADEVSTQGIGGIYALPHTIEICVPRFGSAYKSVAIIMTRTELEPSVGQAQAKAVPYDYSYWAEKGFSGAITKDTTWPPPELITGAEFLVDGMVTVQSPAELVVLPGTTLRFSDPDATPAQGDQVGISVDGRLRADADGAGMIEFLPAGEKWDGIAVGPTGTLSCLNVQALGLRECSCPGDPLSAFVNLRNSAFTFAADGLGCDLRGTFDAIIEDCFFTGVEVLAFGSMAMCGVDPVIRSSTIVQKMGATAPALLLSSSADIEDVQIMSRNGAIKCEAGNVELSNVQTLYMDPAACGMAQTAGLHLVGSAQAVATDCSFDSYCRGVRLDDTSRLTMRGSTIADSRQLGVYIAGRNAIADLGYIGAPGSEGNNCIGHHEQAGIRVFNRSNSQCLAAVNYWGMANPTSALFMGNVAWGDYLSECPVGGGGQFSIGAHTGESAADDGALLKAPWPNPANPASRIEFSLPSTGDRVELVLYDILGREMARLFEGHADGESRALLWNGRVASGAEIKAGVYLLSLRVGQTLYSRKLTVVK